jgi:hypothetical protein
MAQDGCTCCLLEMSEKMSFLLLLALLYHLPGYRCQETAQNAFCPDIDVRKPRRMHSARISMSGNRAECILPGYRCQETA